MSELRSAHALLGLLPGASAAEIRRAFRRLAMQWHPDRNPAADAAEQFKRLRQAHDALLAALRQASDAAATGQTSDDASPADEAAPQQSSRGADRHLELEISLRTAFRGGKERIELGSRSPCAECDGSGEIQLQFTRLCDPCRGSGRIRRQDKLESCSTCNGRGFVNKTACSGCAGSGQQQTVRQLEVHLPPGLVDGDTVRLHGEGEAPDDATGEAGDLQLHIRLASQPPFSCSGRDLLLERPLSALQLLLGGSFTIPHPLGLRHIELAAGDGLPRQLRISGAGFPARGSHPAGDLLLQLRPVMPAALDAELRKQLAAIEARLQDKRARTLAEVAEWEAQWLDAEPEQH